MSRWIKCSIALCIAACASRAPQPARGVPAAPELSVPEDGSKLIFAGRGEGVQIYSCAPKADGSGHEWKLKAPEAEVAGDTGEKLRHYAGPTWEAPDGSKVVGEVKARAVADAAAIPWLLLGAKSTSGAGLLAHARWIQRLDTRGGKTPETGCDADHAGAETRIAYSALYRFWGE